MDKIKVNNRNETTSSTEHELSMPSPEVKEVFDKSWESVGHFLKSNEIVVDIKNIYLFITKNDSRYAYYSNNKIILWEGVIKEGIEHLTYVFVHEILHSLSYNRISLLDKTVRVRGGYKIQNAKEFDGNVDNFKTIIPQTLFQAFNEGVTDMFAQSIIKSSGNNEELVYEEEVNMVFKILNKVCKNEKDCLFDVAQNYFSGDLKFMQKIKKVYGKKSIKLLAELQTIEFLKLTKKGTYLNKALIRRKNILEFFTTDDKNRQEELIDKLI